MVMHPRYAGDVPASELRHMNKLPTPEVRAMYAKKVADAMEAGARALLETAEALRANPDEMLKEAFEPNITGMYPNAAAVLELTCFGSDLSQTEVRSRAIIDGSKFNEIGFRALLKDGAVTPARDNRFG